MIRSHGITLVCWPSLVKFNSVCRLAGRSATLTGTIVRGVHVVTQLVERKLAAILAADVAGYSRPIRHR